MKQINDTKFSIDMEIVKDGKPKEFIFDNSSNKSSPRFDTRIAELENKNKELSEQIEQLQK